MYDSHYVIYFIPSETDFRKKIFTYYPNSSVCIVFLAQPFFHTVRLKYQSPPVRNIDCLLIFSRRYNVKPLMVLTKYALLIA